MKNTTLVRPTFVRRNNDSKHLKAVWLKEVEADIIARNDDVKKTCNKHNNIWRKKSTFPYRKRLR